MGKGQVVAPKPSSSSKKDKTKPKMIEKSTIKKASKSKNQFIEKKIEQVFKMKDSEVTEIKAKTSKIEKKVCWFSCCTRHFDPYNYKANVLLSY